MHARLLQVIAIWLLVLNRAKSCHSLVVRQNNWPRDHLKDNHVQPKIELVSVDKVRMSQIPLNYLGLVLIYIVQRVEKEDTSALTARDRFADINFPRAEFSLQLWIFNWQVKCLWEVVVVVWKLFPAPVHVSC